ncbi:MAG TPA: hypothetical protein VE733_00005 [Streptosporangiaceae bacterium]|jgi:hypothetical protein|nr:hypothetical protein [Streptosporangiaceae bacterium]
MSAETPQQPPGNKWHWIRNAFLGLGALIVIGIVAGVVSGSMNTSNRTSNASAASSPAAAKLSPSPSPSRTTATPSASPSPAPVKTIIEQVPASAAPAAPALTDASAIVAQFYADITARNYTAAWQLGGSNVAGSASYQQWVAGYATTASISIQSAENFGNGEAYVTIEALQTDGSVRTYAGTYYTAGSVITAAHIQQTN